MEGILSEIILFAKNDPQLAFMITIIGAIFVFFLINMIGGDKRE
jgi:hypothetical protein